MPGLQSHRTNATNIVKERKNCSLTIGAESQKLPAPVYIEKTFICSYTLINDLSSLGEWNLKPVVLGWIKDKNRRTKDYLNAKQQDWLKHFFFSNLSK